VIIGDLVDKWMKSFHVNSTVRFSTQTKFNQNELKQIQFNPIQLNSTQIQNVHASDMVCDVKHSTFFNCFKLF